MPGWVFYVFAGEYPADYGGHLTAIVDHLLYVFFGNTADAAYGDG